MILPKLGMSAEIPLSEGTTYNTLFDGVYMDERTYKEYVFKSVNYDDLYKSHNQLVIDFEQYKESDDPCQVFELPETWFIMTVFFLGVIGGIATQR